MIIFLGKVSEVKYLLVTGQTKLYIHTVEYYSVIKSEETTHAFSNMNESHSHNYAEWKKLDSKGYTLP